MRIPGIPFVQGRNAYTDRDGRKYGIAIHNTANDATAEGEASYATRRTEGVSSHFYCDADSVVQSLDTDARAGHAGSTEGNDNAIAVEITGVNGWTRQQWLDRVAWAKLGAVLAVLCKAYGIEVRRATVAEMKTNPRVKAFYGHNDMRLAWAGTTHTDPGPNFPWDRLFAAVNTAMGDEMATLDQDDLRNIGLTVATWDFVDGPNVEPAYKVALRAADNAQAAAAMAKAAADGVAELKARPPVAIDYDQLADALLRRVLTPPA